MLAVGSAPVQAATVPPGELGTRKRSRVALQDFTPTRDELIAEALRCLRLPQKRLPSALLYDDAGARLLDEIRALVEYYPARTEAAVVEAHAREIAALAGERCLLVELGNGGGTVTRAILDNLRCPAGYVPIDACGDHLLRSAKTVAAEYPDLEVSAICAPPSRCPELPPIESARKIIWLQGSSLDDPDAVAESLSRIASWCAPGDGVLLCADLEKSPAVLHRAYNDSLGVVAELDRNALVRLECDLGATIDVEQFEHYAFYNPAQRRVEMHLVSLRDQSLQLGGSEVSLRQGESLWTASSRKYNRDEPAGLAAPLGFGVQRVWTDARGRLSVQYLAFGAGQAAGTAER